MKVAKDERLRETRNAMHVMQAKLDEQLKIKLDALNGLFKTRLLIPKTFPFDSSSTFAIFSRN